jgi:hypothetical protein
MVNLDVMVQYLYTYDGDLNEAKIHANMDGCIWSNDIWSLAYSIYKGNDDGRFQEGIDIGILDDDSIVVE